MVKSGKSSTENSTTVLFATSQDLAEPLEVELAVGTAVVFSARCPGKETPNEDACALFQTGETSGLIVIADGAGGSRAGQEASAIALQEIRRALEAGAGAGGNARTAVLDGVEAAHEAVAELGVGAGTTLVALEIEGQSIRPYHVGDSQALVCGQRGKLKLQTMAHAPVAYAVEAGVLDEDDALHHEERHLVSNLIGAAPMSIEIGEPLCIGPRDTLIAATDGLFDNLLIGEIVDTLRCGPLHRQVERLVQDCMARMEAPRAGEPSKPDDLTVVAWRPAAGR